MADINSSAIEADKFGRRRRLRFAGAKRRIGRKQRILREEVKNVSEQQFLVLLLMPQSKLDQEPQIFREFALVQNTAHGAVNVAAIFSHFLGRRPG